MNPLTEAVSTVKAHGRIVLAGITLLLMVVVLLVVFHSYQQRHQQQSTLIIRDMARANDELNRGFLHLHLGSSANSPWEYESGPVLIWQAVQQYGNMAELLAQAPEVSDQLQHLQQHLTEMLAEVRAFSPLELQQAMYHHTGEASELDRQIRLVLEAQASRLNWLFSIATLTAVLLILVSGLLMLRAERGRAKAIQQLLESESRLRELSECISDALWLKDAHSGKTVYISPAYDHLWGQSREAQLQNPDSWLSALHPEDRERTVSAFHAMLTDPVNNRFDEIFRIILPDNSQRWIHDTAYPVTDESGQVVRIAGIARDITLRYQERERLNLLNTAIARLNDIVMITEASPLDEPGPRVLFVNDSFEKITGYSRDEIIGQNPRILQGPDTDREVTRQIRDALEAGQPFNGEITNYRKDGSEIRIELEIVPILDPRGQITHWVSVERDVTSRRAMEAELQHAQRMEAIGHLTGGLAHDFNNLLTVILGNADLLTEQIQDEHLIPLARIISMAAHRGAELTQQLLAFARQQVLEPKVIDPLRQLNAMQTLLTRSIGEHIRLSISALGPLSHIKVDPSRFENALLNLCINARDAMPEGGKISITLRNTRLNLSDSNRYSDVVPGEYVEILITDTGHGIPQELVQKVFDPFFTTKEKGKGTGLGLSMVFGFVRQSGGHISLESTTGKGTQLALYLPAVATPEPIQFSPEAQRSTAFIPARILLAEDDPLVREYAALQLRNAGYEVKVSANGVEAMEQLQQDGPFDLLFTDVLMPEMNGPELARQAVQVQPGLKVVFTSGFFEGEELEQVLNTPLNHLLAKPYQREDMLALINEVLADPNPHLNDSQDRP